MNRATPNSSKAATPNAQVVRTLAMPGPPTGRLISNAAQAAAQAIAEAASQYGSSGTSNATSARGSTTSVILRLLQQLVSGSLAVLSELDAPRDREALAFDAVELRA